MKNNRLLAALTLAAMLVCAAAFAPRALAQTSEAKLDRTSLPIAEPDYPRSTVLDARDAKAPPRFEIKAPAGAPNVLIVLVDDMGFGMPSAFGGPVRMPSADRLANQGLRFNQFHTTALCSPTRTALLSGRNHHMNNMGSITETATGFPGNTGQRPNSVAPLAEMLRLNGYSTAFFGKNHETAPWEVSLSGPTDRWPTRSGFDKFYGFFGGETDQWNPTLYDGMARIPTPHHPGYNFMTDMTDQAISWMKFQKSLTPDKPFFMYFAPGATHAPHHVPKEWIAKNKGRFDWRLGQAARGNAGPADRAGRGAQGHEAGRQARRTSRTGTSSAPTRRSSSPGRWKSIPPSGNTRTTRSAASSMPSARPASSRTPSSSTSSATTAPAPRAA